MEDCRWWASRLLPALMHMVDDADDGDNDEHLTLLRPPVQNVSILRSAGLFREPATPTALAQGTYIALPDLP